MPHNVNQVGRSKTRTAKGTPSCKRRPRTLSRQEPSASAAKQQESHHALLYGWFMSMDTSQAMNWNVMQARTSCASRGSHTCRLALQPCRTTTAHVWCASKPSTSACHISSSGWPLTSGRSAMQASSTMAAVAGSSSSPMGTHRHGRSGRLRPCKEKFEVSNDFYVTAM